MREWRGSYSVLWERGDGNRQSEMKYVEMQEEIILDWILRKWNWVIEWIDVAPTTNIKATCSLIMLVSTNVYGVTTHNTDFQ
jgi:hypothetical protein